MSVIAVVNPAASNDAIISKLTTRTSNAEFSFRTNIGYVEDELDGSVTQSAGSSINYNERNIIEYTRNPDDGRLRCYVNGFLRATSS